MLLRCCGRGCGAVVLCFGAAVVLRLWCRHSFPLVNKRSRSFYRLGNCELSWVVFNAYALWIAREEEQLNQPSSYTTDYGNEGSPADDFLVTHSLVQAVDFRL